MAKGVSLKEYFESKIDDVKESVKTAYNSMEKRLEGMNEFRDQLKDQAARFVTRDELDARLENINKNKKDSTSLILSVIGLIASIIAILIKIFVK